MNFLAHAFLARNSASLLIGNYIGDFVKGKNLSAYSPEIAEGIVMHRKIDYFTDTHPVFIRSKNRIREKYRHYTGVIIDLFYDHMLAANWNHFCQEDLEGFTLRVYKIIMDHYDIIPPDAQYMIPFMKKSNWLMGYGTIEGIDRSLRGMSKRTPFKSGMEHASTDLTLHYPDFKTDFFEFFPELITYLENNLKT